MCWAKEGRMREELRAAAAVQRSAGADFPYPVHWLFLARGDILQMVNFKTNAHTTSLHPQQDSNNQVDAHRYLQRTYPVVAATLLHDRCSIHPPTHTYLLHGFCLLLLPSRHPVVVPQLDQVPAKAQSIKQGKGAEARVRVSNQSHRTTKNHKCTISPRAR